MAKAIRGGHINSEELLSRQSDSYEAQINALKELHESDKKLSLEKQAAIYQRKVAELESEINELLTQQAELGHEKDRLQRALPSTELLSSDLRDKPITERASELGDDIDRATPISYVRLCKSIDGQIFGGYRQYPSLSDKEIQDAICQVVWSITEFFKNPREAVIVLSGAGTSGRLAFYLARAFNNVLEKLGRPAIMRYCNAGGDPALFLSVESAEDDPAAAVADLERVSTDAGGALHNRVYYIGISCGLSATYIGAQIQHIMNDKRYISCVIGFNPPQLARKTLVSGWNTNFAQVLEEYQRIAKTSHYRNSILTPVVGPEAIQGSSRLKGGSATKILLETILSLAISQALRCPLMEGPPVPKMNSESEGTKNESAGLSEDSATGISSFFSGLFGAKGPGTSMEPSAPALQRGEVFETPLRRVFGAYESTIEAVYLSPIHEVLEIATETLRSKRHIWYLGSSGVAALGMIDAAEQVPTFGCREKDVRGFITGGWESLGKYKALSNLAKEMTASGLPAVSVDHFLNHFAPAANTSDLVILLQSRTAGPALSVETTAQLANMRQQRGFQLVVVDIVAADRGQSDEAASTPAEPSNLEAFAAIDTLAKRSNYHLKINLLPIASMPLVGDLDAFGELAIKLCCNIISTGAWIRMGKVYRSRMIDVKVTNVKLFHRAIGIIAEISGITMDKARESLLRCVHDIETNKPLPKGMMSMKAQDIIPRSSMMTNIVTMSILICHGKYNLASARQALNEGKNTLRDLVVSALPSKKNES